jgi:cell division protein FtsB
MVDQWATVTEVSDLVSKLAGEIERLDEENRKLREIVSDLEFEAYGTDYILRDESL